MNQVELVGRLTDVPSLRYSPSGVPVSNMTVAVDRQLSKEQREREGVQTADFIRCVVFNKQAENAAEYLVKGQRVALTGRLQTRSWTAEDGSKHYMTEVAVFNLDYLDKPRGANGTTEGEPTAPAMPDEEEVPVPF